MFHCLQICKCYIRDLNRFLEFLKYIQEHILIHLYGQSKPFELLT